MAIQEMTMQEIEEVSGGGTVAGAAMTLGATLAGIAVGVATGGVIGVVAIGAAAVGGLAYAYDYYTEAK